MPFAYDYTLTRFTPAEAERITGVNVTLQRDWRRRGFLPSNEGHARFDVFSLAKMRFLSAMAERGIGPASTEKTGDITMNAIAREALSGENAAEGDTHRGGPRLMAMSVISRCSPLGGKMGRLITGPIFVLFADGTEWWDQSPDAAFNRKIEAEDWGALDGPVIMLDTRVLGVGIAARAGRPLVTVRRVDD